MKPESHSEGALCRYLGFTTDSDLAFIFPDSTACWGPGSKETTGNGDDRPPCTANQLSARRWPWHHWSQGQTRWRTCVCTVSSVNSVSSFPHSPCLGCVRACTCVYYMLALILNYLYSLLVFWNGPWVLHCFLWSCQWRWQFVCYIKFLIHRKGKRTPWRWKTYESKTIGAYCIILWKLKKNSSM